MPNNHAAQSNDKQPGDRGKEVAELNCKLSLLDSIRQNAGAQKLQLVAETKEQEQEASPSQRGDLRKLTTSTQITKTAAPSEKSSETGEKAAPAPQQSNTHFEVKEHFVAQTSYSLSHRTEFCPASLQAKLNSIDFLLVDTEQEAARIKSALGDPTNSADRDPQQIDVHLPGLALDPLQNYRQK